MIKLLCPRGEQTSGIRIILFTGNSKLNDSSHHNTDRSELLESKCGRTVPAHCFAATHRNHSNPGKSLGHPILFEASNVRSDSSLHH